MRRHRTTSLAQLDDLVAYSCPDSESPDPSGRYPRCGCSAVHRAGFPERHTRKTVVEKFLLENPSPHVPLATSAASMRSRLSASTMSAVIISEISRLHLRVLPHKGRNELVEQVGAIVGITPDAISPPSHPSIGNRLPDVVVGLERLTRLLQHHGSRLRRGSPASFERSSSTTPSSSSSDLICILNDGCVTKTVLGSLRKTATVGNRQQVFD